MHSDIVDTDSFLIYSPLQLLWWVENVSNRIIAYSGILNYVSVKCIVHRSNCTTSQWLPVVIAFLTVKLVCPWSPSTDAIWKPVGCRRAERVVVLMILELIDGKLLSFSPWKCSDLSDFFLLQAREVIDFSSRQWNGVWISMNEKRFLLIKRHKLLTRIQAQTPPRDLWEVGLFAV